MGTIGRAFHLVSYNSVKMLLQKIIEELGSIDYHPFIMYDLNITSESKQIRINKFFEITENNECNLEIAIKNNELPQFSDKSFNYFKVSNDSISSKKLTNFLDLQSDLSQYIFDNE
jgi:hypothetical protein